ncbi:uncharacterized protein LOC119682360 [Teleopsis dalmanni]|uniref:uncharacterized protein LOC119682360 n=1 Tax=Teleopsis dalmanni TaxID=139649 RepID=UPI0018CCE71A|nr:uncharacterized protein LOC119682360 [Teleopsis dalmanni]
MLYEEGIGEEFEEPNIYVGYNCNDILIQHRHYAAVRFEIVNNSIYNIHLDVFAIDGIHITHDIVDRKFLDSIYKEKDENDDNEDFKSKSTESGEEKKFLEDEEAPVFVPVLKVSFENKFRVAVTPNDCHMLAYLERYNDLEEVEIDAFDFILDFKWDLHKIFYSFIKKMNQFKNYKKPKSKELFFIESVSLKGKPRLQPRGFEFYDELPELTDLHVAKSNTLIELIPLQNIDERMQNEYAHYKKDMLKFPRFRKRDPKDTEIEFPPILSVK